jgi:hypothetical protein
VNSAEEEFEIGVTIWWPAKANAPDRGNDETPEFVLQDVVKPPASTQSGVMAATPATARVFNALP